MSPTRSICFVRCNRRNQSRPKNRADQNTKADLVAALKTAVAYCDKAYDGMTDASGTQMVKFFGQDMPKFRRAEHQQHA